MKSRVSLSKTSALLFAALISAAIVFGFGTVHFSNEIEEINVSWLSFKSQHAEKARLKTSLRATLGYGGMIHDFKNYILRKDLDRQIRLQKSLGAAQTIIAQYRVMSTTQAERLALDDIQAMVDKYQEATNLVREAIQNGKSSSEIDKLVRINDTFALRALGMLRKVLIDEHAFFTDETQKPVILGAIRSELGYGGLIHFFKNYVLRQKQEYYEKARNAFDKLFQLIDTYRQLTLSLGEVAALEDLENTLKEYRANLDIAKDMASQGESPEAIDHAVKVDDAYALRGLKTLEQVIVLQIEKRSNSVSDRITNLSRSERLYTQTAMALMLLLAIFLIWTFTQNIIRPIKEISSTMMELADGNLDIDLPAADQQTELGMMAHALHAFKSGELKRRDAEQEIRRMAMTDPLTGLANRNQFNLRYKEMEAIAKREGKILALLAFDLDRFKPINDSLGHAAGDTVLKHVAQSLLLTFRETDLVARLGGDEFAALLYGPEDLESITHAAKRVIDLLSNPITIDGKDVSVGVSIGISLFQPAKEHKSLETLIRNADRALYEAKESGRNTYRVYEADQNREKVSLLHPTKPE